MMILQRLFAILKNILFFKNISNIALIFFGYQKNLRKFAIFYIVLKEMKNF